MKVRNKIIKLRKEEKGTSQIDFQIIKTKKVSCLKSKVSKVTKAQELK